MENQIKLSNQLCFQIYNLSKEMVGLYRPLLEDLDITYPQFLVMLVLWEHQKINVKEIGMLLNLDSGTLTPLLKRLEAKQLVLRERSKKDERIVEISLTEKGEKYKEKALCIPDKLISKINLNKDEQIQFKQLINKISKSLKL